MGNARPAFRLLLIIAAQLASQQSRSLRLVSIGAGLGCESNGMLACGPRHEADNLRSRLQTPVLVFEQANPCSQQLCLQFEFELQHFVDP